MTLDAAWALAWARLAARTINEHCEELTDLDAAIGDADHGHNLQRGFQAVAARLDAYEADGEAPSTPSAVMQDVARTLLSTVGGASGPLLGSALARAARLTDAPALDGAQIALMLRAAAEAIVARGHAEPGDKTMLDVWEPAAQAAQALVEQRGERVPAAREVLEVATDAAQRGAADTVELRARKGRASYLGERSRGHMDPGARSSYLLLAAAYEAACEVVQSPPTEEDSDE